MRKISSWFNQETSPRNQHIRRCDFDGCEQEGLYKAPIDRVASTAPNQNWYWFCKQHVRNYNEKWNYFSGMNEDQAYITYKNDTMWNRPSWSLHQKFTPHHIHDPYGFFEQPVQKILSNEEKHSLSILDLPFPFSLEQLQNSYRQLAKINHPDIMKSKESEERIRDINEAYQCLKNFLNNWNVR